MKKHIVMAAILAAGSVTGAYAQASGESPWMVRVRSVHLDSSNKDSTPLGLSINNKTFGEVDVTYFMSPNLAAELVLTTPQKQTVYANGSEIGSFKHLPPSLLMQYHITDLQGIKPYVGAGINYTRFSDVSLPAGVSLDSHSWGWAFQAGLDIPLDRNWSINLDVKKAYIRSDVYVAGSSIGRLKVDPVLYSVGLGYRF
jgi:outer membrane protein